MIVYCCQDLIFATKIGSTAEALGLPARPARNVEALAKRLEQVDDGRLNEPVSVVFIDLELADAALEMIGRIKDHDAALPVVTFGSHVATQLLESARAKGDDFVMPRSQFTVQLPALLERFGKQ